LHCIGHDWIEAASQARKHGMREKLEGTEAICSFPAHLTSMEDARGDPPSGPAA